MKINEPEGNNNNDKKVPVGMHPARCIYVIDLGKQEDTWDGKTTIKHKKKTKKYQLP